MHRWVISLQSVGGLKPPSNALASADSLSLYQRCSGRSPADQRGQYLPLAHVSQYGSNTRPIPGHLASGHYFQETVSRFMMMRACLPSRLPPCLDLLPVVFFEASCHVSPLCSCSLLPAGEYTSVLEHPAGLRRLGRGKTCAEGSARPGAAR
jgi:hypothetical protein